MPTKFASKPALVFLTLIGLAALLLPLNFIILEPGPTSNLLNANVSIANNQIGQSQDTDLKSGAIFSTTVFVTSPGDHPNGLAILHAWLDGNLVVEPTASLYRKGESAKAATLREKNQMLVSQIDAAIAAHNFLTNSSSKTPPMWQPGDVSIKMKHVGGSSAGLAFALAILEKGGDLALIKGRKIAVTGTITQKGDVGIIGGIDQKILGAKSSGANIFIAPRGNCAQISKYPKGMQIYAVRNIGEAVSVLSGEANSLSFTCPGK